MVLARDDPPAEVEIGPDSAVVLMTHSFAQDAERLRQVLPRRPRYLGLLGPRPRAERLFAEIDVPPSALTSQAPVGLDIGAETPQAIAVAIVAEIPAVLAGRPGGSIETPGWPGPRSRFGGWDASRLRGLLVSAPRAGWPEAPDRPCTKKRPAVLTAGRSELETGLVEAVAGDRQGLRGEVWPPRVRATVTGWVGSTVLRLTPRASRETAYWLFACGSTVTSSVLFWYS